MGELRDVKVRKSVWPWWSWRVRYYSENKLWQRSGKKMGENRARMKANAVAIQVADSSATGGDWVDA